jgi:AraC-like DNA-binding protein
VRYAELLRSPVSFGAAEDAIIVEPADLDREAAGHDAELLEFVERSLIASAEREPLEFRERLNKTIAYLLAIQSPRLRAAAAAMGMSSRTLQRRLASEGASFQELLCEARRQIVEDSLLRQRRPSLSRLAERTGYSDASAVSRFIRTHSGRLVRR